MSDVFGILVRGAAARLDEVGILARAREIASEEGGHLDPSVRIVPWSQAVGDDQLFVPGGGRGLALEGRAERRKEAAVHLEWLALACLDSGGRVFIVRYHADADLSRVKDQGRASMATIASTGGDGQWEVDFGTIRFKFSDVDVHLTTPLVFDGDKRAVGYFADFESAGLSVADASRNLRDALGGAGSYIRELPRPRVVARTNGLSIARRVSGCVYYGGE